MNELFSNEYLCLRMDKRIYDASQYISSRVIELAGEPYEIGFIYGGNISTRKQGSNVYSQKTTITIDDLLIPKEQIITASTFDSSAKNQVLAKNYFRSRGKRIVGMGHSHAKYDVFHSGADKQNLERVIHSLGNTVTPVQRFKHILQKRQFKRNKIYCRSVEKIIEVENCPYSVFPSFVFNEEGSFVDCQVATYSDTFSLITNSFEIFNRRKVLTQIDKKRLDREIITVLKYNNIPIRLNKRCTDRFNLYRKKRKKRVKN